MMREDFSPNFAQLCRDAGSSSLEEYGRFQQHLVLLEDRGRISKFATAIARMSGGDVVVDVGAGTGVLGLLALKNGYEHAYLVEPSRKMAAYAKHLAGLNGLLERVTILNSTLEALDHARLPAKIDLVVSETISSLVFGFGCWDALPALLARTGGEGRIVPRSGKLFAAATEGSLATRGPASDGLAALASAGLTVDLFERTFRSGGNVYDKQVVARLLANEELRASELALFDFSSPRPTTLRECVVSSATAQVATGLLLFWDIELAPGVSMTNLDPVVTSWYPLYVPLKRSLPLPATIELRLLAIDAPYTYAFQFTSDNEPVTHVLYW